MYAFTEHDHWKNKEFRYTVSDTKLIGCISEINGEVWKVQSFLKASLIHNYSERDFTSISLQMVILFSFWKLSTTVWSTMATIKYFIAILIFLWKWILLFQNLYFLAKWINQISEILVPVYHKCNTYLPAISLLFLFKLIHLL